MNLLPVDLPHQLVPVIPFLVFSIPIPSCKGSGHQEALNTERSETLLISYASRSSPPSSKALYGAGAPSSSSPPPHPSAVPSIHPPTSPRAESRAVREARSRKQVAGRPWAPQRGGGGVSSRAGRGRWRQLRYDVQLRGTAFGRL